MLQREYTSARMMRMNWHVRSAVILLSRNAFVFASYMFWRPTQRLCLMADVTQQEPWSFPLVKITSNRTTTDAFVKRLKISAHSRCRAGRAGWLRKRKDAAGLFFHLLITQCLIIHCEVQGCRWRLFTLSINLQIILSIDFLVYKISEKAQFVNEFET